MKRNCAISPKMKDFETEGKSDFLSELCDAMSEGVICTGEDGTVRYLNPAASKILHLSGEQLLGMSVIELFPEDSIDQSFRPEKIGVCRDGVLLEFSRFRSEAEWPETAMKPILPPGYGQPLMLMSFTPVADSDETYMLDAVLAQIPCQVFIKDVWDDFRYKVANRNFSDYYHLLPEYVVNRNDYELFEREVADQLREHDQKACTAMGEVFRFDEDISFNRTGNEVFQSLKVGFETAKRHPYLLGVCVDMTDMHRVQEQLAATLAEARRAFQVRSYFFSTMSHELRTPLNAIIGFSELLRDSSLSIEARADYLEEINLSGTTLLHLLNDILELTKSESEELPVQWEKVNLRSFCDTVCSVFRLETKQKGLTLTVLYPEPLPEFYIGQSCLRQILLNLIGNAVKFTSRGSVSVTVSCDIIDADHAGLTIAVADTGCGIAPEFQKKICLPFEREGESVLRKRGTPGAGLGLPLAKRLVDRLGGRLEIESEDGVGSTFAIVFDSLKIESEIHPYLGTEG